MMKLFEVLQRMIKKYGFWGTMQFGFLVIVDFIIYKKFMKQTFQFEGKKYDYYNEIYNGTNTNERSIEIPIVWKIVNDFIKQFENEPILEVGNVLSKYFPFNHTIIDKYEINENVVNKDIVDFKPQKVYKLIISISTLEHVGFDEEKIEPNKVVKTFENLKNALSSDGKIIVTLPLGYNPSLDDFLKNRILKFDEMFFMKRVSKNNRWEQVSEEKVFLKKYSNKFPPHANELFIGIIQHNQN